MTRTPHSTDAPRLSGIRTGPEDSDQAACMVTQSRVKLWWLTRFKAYHLVHAALVPEHTALGGVRYRGTWWLRPKPGNTSGSSQPPQG